MRAWLACASTWPSGRRSATHNAPFPKLPLPMNSMYHTCRVAPDVVRAHPNPSHNHNPDPNLESTLTSMYHTSPERASPIEKPSMSEA